MANVKSFEKWVKLQGKKLRYLEEQVSRAGTIQGLV
jgi:hypothetical protein